MSRLCELLARNLGISKTAAARLMEAGRILDANGVPLTDRKAAVPRPDPEQEMARTETAGTDQLPSPPAPPPPCVFFCDRPVALWDHALVLQHKPVGVVTALRDPMHPTAFDLLREAPLFPELRAAGRLDLETSGLLLWSTEGALIQRLTHPKRRVPRTYQAALARPFAPPPAELTLEDGHRPTILELRDLDGGDAHPGLEIPVGTAQLATLTLVGGAYHEVRRIFAALGSHVLGLCRIRFGPYELPPDLPPGAWRLLPDVPAPS